MTTPIYTRNDHRILRKMSIKRLSLFGLLLMFLLISQWLKAEDISSQSSTTPNASTDPNQPSILDTSGIPNSTLPAQSSQVACTNPAGNPNGCGESNIASQGNQSQTNMGAGNPINVITGNKYQREADLPALPGLMGIEIVRHYNSLHLGLGQIGYGWRLSYETDLQVVSNSLYITQADGSRVIFNRSSFNPSDCACQNPAQGHVMIYHTAKGDEYTWYWLDGKQLHFNHQGKLERITAPTGESVHLTRGLKGELLKVTDPQGRSLIMHYADKHQPGFKGIVAIDTPVGRYVYQHDNDPKSAGISNVIAVDYPNSSSDNTQVSRHYYYGEASYVSVPMATATPQTVVPKASHLLTGISLTWQADKHQQQQRLRTWAYDAWGRGVLSVHGRPKQLDATGKVMPDTGLQQVSLRYQMSPVQASHRQSRVNNSADSIKTTASKTDPFKANVSYPRLTHNGQLGQTILTNSLGQTTTYNYTLIAGQPRLLQVVGAGCEECGETNRVYGYDKLGRLSHNTQVSQVLADKPVKAAKDNKRAQKANRPQHAQANTVLKGLLTTHTEYDLIGRPIRISQITYINGKAQAPQLKVRYAYANSPTFPQLNSASRAVEEPTYVASQPSLIATPSVVAGQEHQVSIAYNQSGQPLTVTESGFSPTLPAHTQYNQTAEAKTSRSATPISRTTHYAYKTINGRSLLTQTDGPLSNGKTNSPQDSDITQYHYDRLGQYLTQITAPNNIVTKLEYDVQGQSALTGGTGRVMQAIAGNGIATRYRYANLGYNVGKILGTQRLPASLSLAAAKAAGLVQTTSQAYDVFGNLTMMQRADGQVVYLQYGVNGKLTQLRDGLGNRVEWKDWNARSGDTTQTMTTQQWFTADAPDTVARAWYFWHDDQQRMTQRLNPDGGLDTWRYSEPANPDQTGGPDKASQNQTQWVQHIDPLNRVTLNVVNNQAAAQIRMTLDGYVDASVKQNPHSDHIQQIASIKPSSPVKQISDDFGRVIQFSSPQHGTHIASYDAVNHIVQIMQADDTQIDYIYDVAGRLLKKSAQQVPHHSALTSISNRQSVTYRYNAFGLTEVNDGLQTTRYQQDALGREIDKTTTLAIPNNTANTYHIRTRYDNQGRIKAKQLIDGQWLVFSLDHKTGLAQTMRLHHTLWPSLTNRLADWFNLPDLPLQIATTKVVVEDMAVHPFNGITHLTHGNGISDDYNFDIAGRLTAVNHRAYSNDSAQQTSSHNNKTGKPLVQASYTYDAGRRLISEQISTAQLPGKVNTYAYTGWNQLATPPKSDFIKALASSSTHTNISADSTTVRYANADRAETTLDPAGRTTSDGSYRYQYNVWGKLSTVQVNTNNQTIATYQNNALGERIMASYPISEHNQTRYYLYDHQQRIAEFDENGHVLQQYLYINQTPVAVINTPTAKQEQEMAGIIAIHTDRRHAPVAATNEQGKIIWQAEYDAWGKLIPASHAVQSNIANTFNLSLRLSGQWQDQATGLYYNYQRDYNPDTGRYLTPDPLGFPDGADPYAYVNNDPLNKQDPLGLYQSDIHYYMTFFLAVAAGVPVEDARIIALATQYVDDNDDTRPINLNGLDDHRARLLTYHFTAIDDIKIDPATGKVSGKLGEYGNPSVDTNTGVRPSNDQLTRLLQASETAKRCLTKNAELQLFGEYLHAFEDTFAHRDQNNNPFALNVGLGHGGYGSDPDYTYNHWGLLPTPTNWGNNASRTYSMELLVFLEMKKYATGDDVITQGKISEQDFNQLLKDFNAIDESEGDGYEKGDNSNPLSPVAPSGAKVDSLQRKLNDWFGAGVINLKDFFSAAYSKTEASSNRTSFLCENGQPLDQKDYPGTILPTSCN